MPRIAPLIVLLACCPFLLAPANAPFAPTDATANERPSDDTPSDNGSSDNGSSEDGSSEDGHRASNPVFRILVDDPDPKPNATDASGTIDVERSPAKLRLPDPTMADGLDAAEQREVLRKLAADRYDLDDLLRPSVVAPYVLNLDREPLADGDLIAQHVRLGFVARGDLDALTREDFLASLAPENDDDGADGDSGEIPPEAWQQAGIEPPASPPSPNHADHERVRRFETTLFDRIRLRGVVRAYWTETDDSILFAAVTDDRFASVDGLRPSWTRFERGADGSLAEAESGDFAGGGFYLKITRLREPEDALFFESNGVLLESKSWFGGANLIGSKLPPAIQSQVRDVRRQSIRASRQ